MKKVLFVDDDDTYQVIMQHIAEMSGVKIDKCYDPYSAITMTEFNSYDIVLIDQRLPDMSGTELINVLSEKYPSTEFYIVTNFPKEFIKEEMKDTRIKGFIDKHNLYHKCQEVFCAG